MKRQHSIEQQIIGSRPKNMSSNLEFSDAVMKKITSREIISAQFRKTNVKQKETFIMKLRSLPTFTLIAIIFVSVLLLTGTVYAVVETVKSNIKINDSGTNQYGREELNVTANNCPSMSKNGAIYELKRDANLGVDDGAKTLQARCEIDIVNSSLTKSDPNVFPTPFRFGETDKINAIDGSTITFAKSGKIEIKNDSKFFSGLNELSKDDIKVGATVFVYPNSSSNFKRDSAAEPLSVYVLSQASKYYGLDYQSYVNERGPCPGNATRICLKPSNINHTELVIAHGGGYYSGGVNLDFKEVQGKVTDYNNTSFTLDVGDGVIYTFKTNSNIIKKYNNSDVYGLSKIDDIYAHTNPEDLKVNKGDSLSVIYIGATAETSRIVDWSKIVTTSLMVERIPSDLSVLKKY